MGLRLSVSLSACLSDCRSFCLSVSPSVALNQHLTPTRLFLIRYGRLKTHTFLVIKQLHIASLASALSLCSCWVIFRPDLSAFFFVFLQFFLYIFLSYAPNQNRARQSRVGWGLLCFTYRINCTTLKLSLCTPWRGVTRSGVQIHRLVTSELDGVSRQLHAPTSLPRERTRRAL
jgi:hypothetical protein